MEEKIVLVLAHYSEKLWLVCCCDLYILMLSYRVDVIIYDGMFRISSHTYIFPGSDAAYFGLSAINLHDPVLSQMWIL